MLLLLLVPVAQSRNSGRRGLRDARHCTKAQFWLDPRVHLRATEMGIRGPSRSHGQPWSCRNFVLSWVSSPWRGLLWKLEAEAEPWPLVLPCCAVLGVKLEQNRSRVWRKPRQAQHGKVQEHCVSHRQIESISKSFWKWV